MKFMNDNINVSRKIHQIYHCSSKGNFQKVRNSIIIIKTSFVQQLDDLWNYYTCLDEF